jgi:hypothetical protein
MSIMRRETIVLFVAGFLSVFGSLVYGQPWDGSGVEGDPYQIWTAEDMQAIGADVNYLDAHFKLCTDIDLSSYIGTSFNIIGNFSTPFTGVFDGRGYTILNFTYSTSGENYIAIFGGIGGVDCRIENVNMLNLNVEAPDGLYISGLVGLNAKGIVSNCAVTGSVTGNTNVGFIVGGNLYGKVNNCYSSGTVAGGGNIGGLTGINFRGEIFASSSSSSVIGNDSTGGLSGASTGTISESFATGTVSGGIFSGGLVGFSEGTIFDSYSTCSVDATGAYAGGLVGFNHSATLENCYAAAAVSGESLTGGLVGLNMGTVTNSFWDTTSSGQDTSAGGIGLPTEDMQKMATFTDYSWDFVGEEVNGTEDIWRMCVDGIDYPHLSWEYSINGDFACGDGVDLIDFSFLSVDWQRDGLEPYEQPDLTGDGVLNIDDIIIFAEHWLGG